MKLKRLSAIFTMALVMVATLAAPKPMHMETLTTTTVETITLAPTATTSGYDCGTARQVCRDIWVDGMSPLCGAAGIPASACSAWAVQHYEACVIVGTDNQCAPYAD